MQKKIKKWHIIALLCIVLIIAIITIIFLGNAFAFQQTNKIPGQFAVLVETPVAIKDGNVFEYTVDETWRNLNLSENAKQIFDGENLCILNEDGSIYYGQDIQQMEELLKEEMPLTSAYSLYMTKKVLELNEEEAFVSINQNLEYLSFRALLHNGEILYEDGDNYERLQMEETPILLSGSYILTEQGNVYYLDTESKGNSDSVVPKLTCVYKGGDMVVINACPTNGRCLGLRKNGTVVSFLVSEYNKPLETGEWKHIVAIQQGFYFAVGLTDKGNVLYVDYDKDKMEAINKELKKWTNIVEIAAPYETIVGLREDGTCLFLNIAELEGE